ncbi:MAG: macro domain-containing protein [Dissulfurispiraceae bacterium]|nr:macro domain-containing protein [Dissulfurispiraceae bacterium]
MTVELKAGSCTMRLVRADITTRDVDAIVNAANTNLQHGGGVAAAIVKKGGSIIQKESNAIGYVPVGEAAVTSGGSLPAKFVIHAVGPRMGEGNEDSKLIKAVKSLLNIAVEHEFKSISIPAVSSGIYGFPKDRCAQILVRTSAEFLAGHPESSLRTLEFCLFDQETYNFFLAEFDKLRLQSI